MWEIHNAQVHEGEAGSGVTAEQESWGLGVWRPFLPISAAAMMCVHFRAPYPTPGRKHNQFQTRATYAAPTFCLFSGWGEKALSLPGLPLGQLAKH